MKKRFYSVTKTLLGSIIFSFTLSSCDKDVNSSSQTSTDADQYAISIIGGTSSASTTYIQGVANFNMATLGTTNATELTGNGYLTTYNGAGYVQVYNSPATLTRYTFDKTGKATQNAQLMVPGAKTFSTIEFVSATEAYASVAGGLAKVVKFNPTTMALISTIDLSSILRAEAPVMYYLGMKARDGKLFMGIYYEGTGFVDKYTDTAYVAVIDLATAKVDKLIKDARTGSIFSARNTFAQDENGDIYVAGFGYTNRPSGILKIKKGATDFDPSYFFNLDATVGMKCRGIALFSNGMAFTLGLVNPADDYEFSGPSFKYYKIDVLKKTAAGQLGTLPTLYGSSGIFMNAFDNSNILLSVSTNAENSIYSYKIADGTVAKQVTLTAGKLGGFSKLK